MYGYSIPFLNNLQLVGIRKGLCDHLIFWKTDADISEEIQTVWQGLVPSVFRRLQKKGGI